MYRRNERNGQLVYPGNQGCPLVTRWRGRRIMDQVSGFWFEEYYATVNDFGETVDSRNRSSYDYETGAVGGPQPMQSGLFT